MVGATQDVTERNLLLENERAARAEAEAARRRSEVLARSVQVFTRSLELDETVRAIADLIVPEVADWCRIDLVGPDGLRPAIVLHRDPELMSRAAVISPQATGEPDAVGSVAWIAATRTSHMTALSPEALALLGDGAVGRFAREVGLTGMIGVPLTVRGLERSNSTVNAAKFSPRGSTISVRVRTFGDEVELAVMDRGVGIPAELLPRIFQHFVQGPQALAREQGGLGLGLAIVANLVALHGGRVAAESDGVGKGTTIRVVLPRASRG